MSEITELPRGSCVLGGVNDVLAAVSKVCAIYHAGPGCCMQTSAGEAAQAGLRSPYYLASVTSPSTNMLEREVIFGGEQRLRDEIDGALEVIDADAYFVLAGCTSGIIGDDIVNIAREYADRGLPVYPIDTPGFAGNSLLGYEVAFQAFLDFIIEKDVEKQPNLVNLVGVVPYHNPHWFGTLEELARILRKLGLEVNTFFTENQDIRVVRNAAAAALNILVDPWLLKGFAEQFEERFGVPSLRFPGLPIGPSDTSKFLRQVSKALVLDELRTERVIREEEAYVYSFFEGIIGVLSWKKFAVVGDAATVIGATRFLANDYSFSPMLAVVTDPIYRPDDKERIVGQLASLDYARPPEIVFETDQYEIQKAVKEHSDITLLIGSSLESEVALELRVQHLLMSFPITDRVVLSKTYGGYRGCLTFVEDLFNNL
jgi:nitrogenase molybdenum-iron protein beta chain